MKWKKLPLYLQDLVANVYQKNYKSFNSRTAEIARDKCLASGIFDKVIISSDDPVFEAHVNSNKGIFIKAKN